MKRITIKLKTEIDSELDLRNISKINFENNLTQISKIKLLYKNQEINLGEIFDLKLKKINERMNELLVLNLNEYCNYLGWKWRQDFLKINSNVGSFLGARMSGGEIQVKGSVENFAGSQMTNGKILIKSNSLDFVGSPLPGNKVGMSGGTIIINGSTRDYLGLNMKKGLIFVSGSARNSCCNNMIAGTVIIKRGIGKYFGIGMKRGTVFLNKKTSVENFFKESNELHTSFFKLLYNLLLKNHGLRAFKKNQRFRRFFGDKNVNGFGELLVTK